MSVLESRLVSNYSTHKNVFARTRLRVRAHASARSASIELVKRERMTVHSLDSHSILACKARASVKLHLIRTVPEALFSLLKRQFGETKIVKRACQVSWFRSWSWLHYDETKDVVLCYIRWKAVYEKKITVRPGNSDDAFVSLVNYSGYIKIIVIHMHMHTLYSFAGVFVIATMKLLHFDSMKEGRVTN